MNSFTRSIDLLQREMDVTSLRYQVTANNLANSEVPNFKRSTVNFESEAIKSYTDVVSNDVYGVATINQTTITSYNKRVITESKLANHNSYWLEPDV